MLRALPTESQKERCELPACRVYDLGGGRGCPCTGGGARPGCPCTVRVKLNRFQHVQDGVSLYSEGQVEQL